jgi:hypothetical protein
MFAALSFCKSAQSHKTLYNGIVLPATWPPRYPGLLLLPGDTMPVPYLKEIPAVIPIDVGRQILVDNFLIERTNLTRTFHQAEYYPENPVLFPDKVWEVTEDKRYATAMPYSDGVWFDPNGRCFKMWYMSGMYDETRMCYAMSNDGVAWTKPSLDVVPGTNIVFERSIDSTTTVWLDMFETDPSRRFKMFEASYKRGWGLSAFFSPDGIHWSTPQRLGKPCGDRTTVFFNPFRNVLDM